MKYIEIGQVRVTAENHAALAQQQEGKLESFRSIFRALSNGKPRLIAGAFAGLIVGIILAVVLPPTYTAQASFVPPGTTMGSSASAIMGQLSSLGAGSLLGNKSQGDLYIGIMKSKTIARAIVRKYQLEKVYGVKKESLAADMLAAHTLFEVGSKDNIVRISVSDKEPRRARDLAQAYLDAVQQTSTHLALTESSQRRLFYEQQLGQAKDQLADAEVALKESQEKTGLISPVGQTAANLQTQQQLQAEIASRQAHLAALSQSETADNPDIQQLRSEIASLQARAAQTASGSASNPFGQVSTAQVPQRELEYVRKAREVKYHEALFDILAKQYEAARLDEAKDAPLQVLDEPVVPDTRSGPKRSLVMAICLLVGFLSAAAWVLLRPRFRGELQVS